MAIKAEFQLSTTKMLKLMAKRQRRNETSRWVADMLRPSVNSRVNLNKNAVRATLQSLLRTKHVTHNDGTHIKLIGTFDRVTPL